MIRLIRRLALVIASVALTACAVYAQPVDPGPLLVPPAEEDFSAPSLRAYQAALLARYGGYLDMPLDVKAEYFLWQLWHYHRTPCFQICNRTDLPDRPGLPPSPRPLSDTSTWNGALLSALSYRYAVTRDPQALEQIAEVLRGLRFCFAVTGQPGLMARTVIRGDGQVLDEMRANRFAAPDGTEYFYQADPARGTYNQIACGYATMMMLAYADLPPDVQRMAREDLSAMVLHVVDHNYRATDRHGKPTTYGDMTPLVGSISVPFNAQVAYSIVALGYCFPPDDPAALSRIRDQFTRLRVRHHVYFEDPLISIVQPQKVASLPFLKGMNDRLHLINAAFNGLVLDLDHARRNGVEFERNFAYELGQSMYWGMDYLDGQRNALCNFQWAALLQDQRLFDSIVKRKPNTVRGKMERNLVEGVEQLRHFQLDRFSYAGQDVQTDSLHWCDEFRPDDYYWKVKPQAIFQKTGPAADTVLCAMDYLHAYWLLRYYRLDEYQPLAKLNLTVLRRTPGL